VIDISKYEGLNEVIDRIINSDEIGIDDLLADSMVIKDGINELLAEVIRLREEVKDYDACLQNLWDNELIPDDTDIWDEVKELLEVG
tara:strand:- start:779 stop:1039 length:261 start_codon:yes stop_codon:yes gene_type:complete